MSGGSVVLLGGHSQTAKPIAGRIRVVDGRFQNDDGWWPWRSISDFAAVHYFQTGQDADFLGRADAYAAAKRTAVRIFGNIGGNLGPVDYRSPGYWPAVERTYAELTSRGLYTSFTCYGYAEIIPDDATYQSLTRDYAQFAKANPGVIIRLANEPYKNGWTNADDPRLLELADIAAEVLGHRDFGIGDAGDGNIPVIQTTLEHCNIALVHPSRDEDSSIYRRWVNHLKSSAEMRDKWRSDAAFVFDEPMGAGVRIPGRRDDDPDALLAAMVVSEFLGCGFTYHQIPEEHAFPADALPGLNEFGTLAADIPITPDWQFSNSVPVATIEWSGLPGKTRNTLSGKKAWSVAYGEADWNSLGWTAGYHATERFAGPRIRVNELETS
jgi:hypothetical protein